MNINFSIIVCTFNPHLGFFKRLIDKLSNLKVSPKIQHEILIIDNNSTEPIESVSFIQTFLTKHQNIRVIKEIKPGLTSARIAGIKQSKYEWCVFFDDDNEPQEDYLVELYKLIVTYHNVYCWGAGTINVEYEDKKRIRLQSLCNELFQQRKIDGVMTGNTREGASYYPPGTGMVLKKEMLEKYINNVEKGIYTMTDRNGNSLTSGGDLQMLYTVLREKYYVGASPSLVINHLIIKKKIKFSYLIKLVYALDATHIKAFNEVFNDTPYPTRRIFNSEIVKSIVHFLLLCINKPNQIRHHVICFSRNMGMKKAQVLAGNYHSPFLLSIFENIMFIF